MSGIGSAGQGPCRIYRSLRMRRGQEERRCTVLLGKNEQGCLLNRSASFHAVQDTTDRAGYSRWARPLANFSRSLCSQAVMRHARGKRRHAKLESHKHVLGA